MVVVRLVVLERDAVGAGGRDADGGLAVLAVVERDGAGKSVRLANLRLPEIRSGKNILDAAGTKILVRGILAAQ